MENENKIPAVSPKDRHDNVELSSMKSFAAHFLTINSHQNDRGAVYRMVKLCHSRRMERSRATSVCRFMVPSPKISRTGPGPPANVSTR